MKIFDEKLQVPVCALSFNAYGDDVSDQIAKLTE